MTVADAPGPDLRVALGHRNAVAAGTISTVVAAAVESCTTPGIRLATPMKLATKTEVGE